MCGEITYWEEQRASRRYAYEAIARAVADELDGAKPADAVKMAQAVIDAAKALMTAEKKVVGKEEQQ